MNKIFFASICKSHKQHFENLLKKSILTYDFKVNDNKISYSFWNQNRECIKTKNYKHHTLNSANVFIKNHQIFSTKKQITFDNLLKKKIIIRDREVKCYTNNYIGIGFYTFKELVL